MCAHTRLLWITHCMEHSVKSKNLLCELIQKELISEEYNYILYI